MAASRSGKWMATNISSLAKSFLESEKNSNTIVDILEYLQTSEDVVVLKAAIKASCKVCCHLVSKYYTWLVPAGTKLSAKLGTSSMHIPVSQSGDDTTKKFREWMKQSYLACTERLLQLLYHNQPDIRWQCLTSLMKLVQAEGSTHQRLSHAYIFPNTFFHVVVSHLLDGEEDMSNLIGRFQEYLDYDDVRFYWLKNIASIVLGKVDSKAKDMKVSEVFISNVHHALRAVTMPASERDIGQFLTGVIDGPGAGGCEGETAQHDDEDEDGEGTDREEDIPPRPKKRKRAAKAMSITKLHKHRKQFSDAWLAFLRLPLSSRLYKRVLTSLHSDVMPHLLDPRLLLDFLTYSYDTGGVVSLLALNGLFILMHEYYLDYPDFYKKLYCLLEPSVFHVKYMPRFFSLLDTFLLSTHLPLYLVAAFAKRIARLALIASPNGVMVATVFVVNLLKRHPNCRVLIHHKNAAEFSYTSGEDPYDMDQEDPANCNALDSCLWELKTLASHFLPAVSELVNKVMTPETVFSDIELDLGKYLDIDDDQLFGESCMEIKDAASVPLNFIEPTSLHLFQQEALS